MRALYFALVVLFVLATTMTVQGHKPYTCHSVGGVCATSCKPYGGNLGAYDCGKGYYCCGPYKKG